MDIVGTGYYPIHHLLSLAGTSLPSVTGIKQHEAAMTIIKPEYSLLSSIPIARMPSLWYQGKTSCHSDHPNQEQTTPGTIDDYISTVLS